jgi:viologen exporter family transport system permease protein
VSAEPMVEEALPETGRVRAMLTFYWANMRMSIAEQFQYRVANYFYMIGMIAEPVIYLVIWSTIARQQGGAVDGLTPGDFAAYYIVWTLVRNMNIVFTPYGWESRIREGQLSGQLLRPMHPLHYDIGFFAGWKVVVVVLWLPIALILSVAFHPTLHPTALGIAVFAVAIWGAYLIRTMNLWLLGMVTFWTTRVSALFETYMVVELLLSGRLVPLRLMPGWAQALANFLPFKWTFGFPIEALVTRRSTGSLLFGLAMQAFWILVGLGLVLLVWRRAIRRYSAVGN